MDTPNPPHASSYHTPLLPEKQPSLGGHSATHRTPLKGFAPVFASVIFLISLVALIINQSQQPLPPSPNNIIEQSSKTMSFPRGVAEGVSAKSNSHLLDYIKGSYNWTNAMFVWQRTSFHFQPEKNWMNDPDGPLFHKGWYHLFYQYNPDSAVWGNITWGHTVSRDLIHWLYLPIAMFPDHWYDLNGVWTGSATILPDGEIVMLYTGSTDQSVQVQNLAYPANLSDPLLLNWVKYPGNPVLVPPANIGPQNFRDPTTAWVGPDGKWRLTIGSKINKTGVSLVFQTIDFKTYELLDGFLHAVPGTGMWECIDFFPVAINGSFGLDTSANGPGIKHVLKASLDDTKVDHYAIGTYNPVTDKWTPDNPEEDVGIGLRVDYGRYYASKSFFDPLKNRRILWGWINETDTKSDDLEKGWASVQTIPRTVLYDNKTGANVIQWPVEEIESLRENSTEFELDVEPGSVVPLDIGVATQLDVFAEFETELSGTGPAEEGYGCGGGAIDGSLMGPFGLLVLADESLSELTPIYFRPTSTRNGTNTYFCADETRSSLAPDVFKKVYGSKVPVLQGENLSMRILVDHSIVESFSQGGRRVITSRIYPTKAIYGSARIFLFNNATGANVYGSNVPVLEAENLSMRILVDHSIVESFSQGGRRVITSRIYPTETIYGSARIFLFNNATGVNVKATLKIWQLNSAFIHHFPFNQI